MSLQGKLLRGLKWFKFKNIDGVYPDEITINSHKMEEMKFYSDFVKIRDANKVHKILEKIMLSDLANKPITMMEEAKKLLDDNLYNEEYKKEQAKIAAKKLEEAKKEEVKKKDVKR